MREIGEKQKEEKEKIVVGEREREREDEHLKIVCLPRRTRPPKYLVTKINGDKAAQPKLF